MLNNCVLLHCQMEGSSISSNDQSSSTSSSDHHSNGFIPSIDSYDGKVMLAAIISLLVVVSFVLLLHLYTRWFLQQQTHDRRRRQLAVSTLYVLDLDPSRLHHHQNRIRTSRASINDMTTGSSSSSSIVDKGLDASIISSLPLFIYKKSDDCDYSNGVLDCVICLSSFEDDDMGRNLPNCKHSFHVECVDTWLHSHSRCPICRAIVVGVPDKLTSKESSINLITEEGSHRELVSGDEPSDAVVDIMTTSPSGIPIQITVSNTSNLEITSALKESPAALPAASSSSFGCSLKRMLSRSRSERKVFPSSSSAVINELNV